MLGHVRNYCAVITFIGLLNNHYCHYFANTLLDIAALIIRCGGGDVEMKPPPPMMAGILSRLLNRLNIVNISLHIFG